MTNGGGGETEQRAHAGSIHCIAACGERVWTSGGVGAAACLREWSAQGALHNNVELTQDGVRHCPAPVAVWFSQICVLVIAAEFWSQGVALRLVKRQLLYKQQTCMSLSECETVMRRRAGEMHAAGGHCC